MSRKPSAASRTVSLFDGERPRPSSAAPDRKVVGGFAEKAGQPSLFGPLQLEIGDAARLARDAARKVVASVAGGSRPSPTGKSIERQQAQLDKARAAAEVAHEHVRAARVANDRAEELEAEAKALRASAKDHEKKGRAASALAAKFAKVKP